MKKKFIIICCIFVMLVISLYFVKDYFKQNNHNIIPYDVWYEQEVVYIKKAVRSLGFDNTEDNIYYAKLRDNTYEYIYEMKNEYTFQVPHKLCITNLSTDESVDILITGENKRGKISDYCQYQVGDVLHFEVRKVNGGALVVWPPSIHDGIVIAGKHI